MLSALLYAVPLLLCSAVLLYCCSAAVSHSLPSYSPVLLPTSPVPLLPCLLLPAVVEMPGEEFEAEMGKLSCPTLHQVLLCLLLYHYNPHTYLYTHLYNPPP
jgi:hypothetical protein